MADAPNPFQAPKSDLGNLPIERGDSVIRISREFSYADRFRSYRIHVDGLMRGQLRAGESINIKVDAGVHTVVAKIDWCCSPAVMLKTKSKSVVNLNAGTNLTGIRFFLSPIYVLLFRNQYIKLTKL